MKKRYLLSLLIIITFNSYSQIIDNNLDLNKSEVEIIPKKIISKIVELDKVVKGFGPEGNSSFTIASRDRFSEQELKAYPQMMNLPDSLTNLKEYCFILNNFQFFYQNYRSGIYSKKYFIERVERSKWNLKDTILLSDKNVKNTISIVSGSTADNRIIYIVDSNNNNDYSDDEPKYLLYNLHKQDDVVENSHTVNIEYFDGASIKKDTQLIMVGNKIGSKDSSLSFKFPQYRYGKVKFDNTDYLIIAESFSFKQSIYLVKDQPYFERLDRKHKVEPSQYLKIDDNYVEYSVVSQNHDKIKLTISPNDMDNKTIPESNQVGMFAPDITGVDILNNMNISLKEYRGKYVFLDFWSTACPPCIKEFPEIKKVYDKFSENDIEIIGIADVRGKIDMKKFIKEKNVTWLNIDDKNPLTMIKGYNIFAWPTTYLIDPNGKIIATNLRGKELNNKLELLKLGKK